MSTRRTPGVYKEEVLRRPTEGLDTGVPAFLGVVEQAPGETKAHEVTLWPQFAAQFPVPQDGFLAPAVRGFFENGGRRCFVVPLPDLSLASLEAGLRVLEPLDDYDLVCAPDAVRAPTDAVAALQGAVLTHCENQGDRFAILDSLSDDTPGTDTVLQQRADLAGDNGALYFPWLRVTDDHGEGFFVPPCGHVAGVYARCDERVGVHKTPANEIVHGVVDLEVRVDDATQGDLNPEGVNCIRALPGRGIRIWGGRTLSREPAWEYISVRRLFTTAGRWIDRNTTSMAFEPNDVRLWARIERELNIYLDGLYEQGALRGASPAEAFYVKCNDETNPPEVRAAGQVVTEIGLAPARPDEHIVIRLIHSASGTTSVSGPHSPG